MADLMCKVKLQEYEWDPKVGALDIAMVCRDLTVCKRVNILLHLKFWSGVGRFACKTVHVR